MTPRNPELHGYWHLPEPLLAFDLSDTAQVTANPLVGLAEFGPVTSRTFDATQTIRIALLAPEPELERLRGQLNQLVQSQEPRERAAYLPAWPGFSQVFKTRLGPADSSAQLPLPESLDEDLKRSGTPHQHLASTLTDGLRRLSLLRDRFDVVVFFLPRRFEHLFENRATGFDLHDNVKAVAAQLGLPSQIVTEDALRYKCRASVAWRLGTALYAKAGGIPWKLDTSQPPLAGDTAYIGLSYALRTAPVGVTTFVTCCSQVFDSDGGGMEFVAYEAGEGTDLRNPYLSRHDMRTVMSRSLALYHDRHGGRSPRELVVHKQTPFQDQEIQGCLDACEAVSDLTCISITRPAWRGVILERPRSGEKKATPGYAVDRGTAFQLDGSSVLLWVAGNAPRATLNGRQNFFQGGKGTPRPLLLQRDAGRGPLTFCAAQVLALSKMDWNNDALYDGVPCTIRYASVLARTIKNMPTLAQRPYDYRLFM